MVGKTNTEGESFQPLDHEVLPFSSQTLTEKWDHVYSGGYLSKTYWWIALAITAA